MSWQGRQNHNKAVVSASRAVYKGCTTCRNKPMMEEDLATMLQRLREEHRSLDAEIGSLQSQAYCDQLLLQRMKKRKLWLKDAMVRIESRLIPDLDA